MHRTCNKNDRHVILGIDFETYWDQKCSVTTLGVTQYMRHPDFKIHGAAVFLGTSKPIWVEVEKLPYLVNKVKAQQDDGVRISVLSHNTNFDGLILSRMLGFVADRYIDTAAMAAAAGIPDRSLRNVAETLGVGVKDSEPLLAVRGVKALTDVQRRDLARYAVSDLALARDIYYLLLPYVDEAEMEAISWTTWAAAIEPFVADLPTAVKVVGDHEQFEQEIVEQSGLDRKTLGSADQLVSYLRGLGVEVDTKPGTARDIPQLAKTDPWVRQVLAGPDGPVRRALEGRVVVRSTMTRTRGFLLKSLAEHGSPFGAVLKAFGSHTGRWSGGDKLNFPNLPGPGSMANGGELSRVIRGRPFADEQVSL